MMYWVGETRDVETNKSTGPIQVIHSEIQEQCETQSNKRSWEMLMHNFKIVRQTNVPGNKVQSSET